MTEMKSLMQCALGDAWNDLPPALQAHLVRVGSAPFLAIP